MLKTNADRTKLKNEKELQNIENLSEDELKRKLEEKKVAKGTNEQEKDLIQYTLNLLDSENRKEGGIIVARIIIAMEKTEEKKKKEIYDSYSRQLQKKYENSDLELYRELSIKIDQTYRKKLAELENSCLPSTPLPNASFQTKSNESNERPPKQAGLLKQQEEIIQMFEKLENQEQLIRQLKIVVGVLALTTIISIASTLFLLIKKWYEGEKSKKVSIFDKKREFPHHY